MSNFDDYDKFLTQVDEQGVDLYELELKNQSKSIPTISDVSNTFSNDRLVNVGKGLYQSARYKERLELYNHLKKFVNNINNTFGSNLTDNSFEFIRYFPNAKFAYFNKLVKIALKDKNKFTQCDANFLSRVWMEQSHKNQMMQFVNSIGINNKSGFTLVPPTKSELPLICDSGTIKTRVRNPGIVGCDDKDRCDCKSDDNTNVFAEIMNNMADDINKLQDKYSLLEDSENLFTYIDDPTINKLVARFVRNSHDSHLTLSELDELSESLNRVTNNYHAKYYLTLTDPFKHRYTKIPDTIGMPSCSFSLRTTVNLTTNASGNVAFAYNPNFLDVNNNSSFVINNNVALTGTASSNFFLGVDIGQRLPAALYTRWRVVSSGIRIICFPSSTSDSGIVTIGYGVSSGGSDAVGAPVASYAEFGNFNLLENMTFIKTDSVASRNILQLNYLPLDESFRDYSAVGNIKVGSAFAGYIQGGPANTAVARVELVVNYEALVDNAFSDYLPSEKPLTTRDTKMVNNMVTTLIDPSELNKKEVLFKNPVKDIKIKDIADNITNIAGKMISTVPKSVKNSFINKLMGYLNPTAYKIIENKVLGMKTIPGLLSSFNY